MYFGNIISDLEIRIDGFKNFNSEQLIDNDLPTIIIGWELTKKIYTNKVSILHKTINLKTYWTFSAKERKVDYETDIETFKEFCYNNFGNNIPYVYLDILYGKKYNNKKIIRKILSLEKPYIFITENEMIYIFGDNIIFGIDLNVLNYFENKKEKIVQKIKKLKESVLVDSEIFNNYRGFIYKIKNKQRLIPYIIKNGNNQ